MRVGRQAELNLLTDWVAKPAAEVYRARVLNVVTIGGVGKSALTWKWFNDVAPQEMKAVNGKPWRYRWRSFYESDASFENFVTRALAYAMRKPRKDVEKISPPEREAQLPGCPRSRAVSGCTQRPGTHSDRLRPHGRGATRRR
jgi:hypothetical protein